MCHVEVISKEVSCVATVSMVSSCPADDDLTQQNVHVVGAHLESSRVLAELETNLSHLHVFKNDDLRPIRSHLDLFFQT